MGLEKIDTCDLVEELKKREGVETFILAPYEIKKFTFEGTMVLLKIID